METMRRYADHIDRRIGQSTFGRIFRLEGSGHAKEIRDSRFLTEIRAGLTTFFTMAYIIAVNATILADTGGTCVCPPTSTDLCVTDAAYMTCVAGTKRDLVTATAAISGASTIAFGFLTNLPIALAPGMGMNAYFAYQVVGFHGSGPVSYKLALAAVFVEGWIFVGLALLGMRQWFVRLLPTSLKVASGCGIGLYLALIGLTYSAGIGAVTAGGVATPTDLGGCPPQFIDTVSGICTQQKMRNPTLWLGIFCGGILTAWLMSYKVKSAMIVGILVTSIISWPRNTSVTYFPYTPAGNDMFDFFKQVVTFHPIQTTLNVIDWDFAGAPSQFVLALFTFLYVDIIDCTATLFSMARFAGVVDPKTHDFPRSTIAYCTDGVACSVGALFGTSPVTAFIESGAGIAEGGKTGLTSMTTGVCFIIAIFFSPIFASIPPWATGCTLIIVGCMMMRQVTLINWRYIGDALPAFVTLFFMPFSYSIAYGLIAGIMTYAAINSLTYITRLVTRGYITPADEDNREYWTWKPAGTAPWFVRAFKSPKTFFSVDEPTSPTTTEKRDLNTNLTSRGSQDSELFSAGEKSVSGEPQASVRDLNMSAAGGHERYYGQDLGVETERERERGFGHSSRVEYDERGLAARGMGLENVVVEGKPRYPPLAAAKRY